MKEQRADYRAGVLASLIFNANRGEKQPPMGPHDFFSSLPAPKKPRRKRQSQEEIYSIFKGLMKKQEQK